jgi:uncharacterized protein
MIAINFQNPVKTRGATHPAGRAVHALLAAAAAARTGWREGLLIVMSLTCGGLAVAQGVPQSLPVTRLAFGMHLVTAEVAQTEGQRQIGLMHRPTMPTHHGMLFVFDEPGLHCFWMKNTLLPLSIAFVADDGSIVNIADMKPMDETSHCPKKAVRMALEMNQGWFAKRGIKPGSQITGEPFGTPVGTR